MDIKKRRATTLLPQGNTLIANSLLKKINRRGTRYRTSEAFKYEIIDFSKTFTEYTISILLTDPEKRSEATLKQLQKVTYEIDFFKKLSDEFSEQTHLECCKHMRYELAPKGSYVFLHGDIGDRFYIIVEGTADVMVPEGSNRRSTLKIGQLEAGNAFGELALIKHQPRMASILCTSHCHLATLRKDDYDAILNSALEQQLEAKVDFLASLHVFATWTRMSLTKLSYLFTERKIKRKIQLYKEGTDVSKVFLVKRGELKIFKTLSVSSHETAHNKRHTSKPRRLDLAIVSTGEFLGVEDVMSGSKHTNSCESLGISIEYYEIGAEEFVSRIMSQQSFSILKSKVEFTDSLRKSRFEVFSKQIYNEVQLDEITALTPNRVMILQQLKTKGLNSFGTDRSNLKKAKIGNKTIFRHRSNLQLQGRQVESPHELRAPSLDDLLIFNKSSLRKAKTTRSPSISVKAISNKVLEPIPYETKIRALRPAFNVNQIKKLSSKFFYTEEKEPSTDFAFIHVDTMTPRKNIWDEQQQQLIDRQFSQIARVSPRYCEHS